MIQTNFPFYRTGFNHDRDQASRESALSCADDPGVTQQQFGEECDINTIVRRFGLTGELPSGLAVPVSGDFTELSDFHTAMNAVRQAEEAFMSLPAELRVRFAHDPQRLIDFVGDEANRAEAIKLGLVPKPVEKARDGSELPGPAV